MNVNRTYGHFCQKYQRNVQCLIQSIILTKHEFDRKPQLLIISGLNCLNKWNIPCYLFAFCYDHDEDDDAVVIGWWRVCPSSIHSLHQIEICCMNTATSLPVAWLNSVRFARFQCSDIIYSVLISNSVAHTSRKLNKACINRKAWLISVISFPFIWIMTCYEYSQLFQFQILVTSLIKLCLLLEKNLSFVVVTNNDILLSYAKPKPSKPQQRQTQTRL